MYLQENNAVFQGNLVIPQHVRMIAAAVKIAFTDDESLLQPRKSL
jgi:hypothetical protein